MLVLRYPLVSTPAPTPSTTITHPYASALRLKSPLGFGLLAPLRRDGKGDFAADGAEDLVRAAVSQILGTRCDGPQTQGEMPWRTAFGSLLYRIRHENNDDVAGALARVYVVQSLTKWEPRVRVKKTSITRENASTVADILTVFRVRIRYDIVFPASPSQVLVRDVNQDVGV